MSKVIKIAAILAVAAVGIGAKQFASVDMSAEGRPVAASIAPMEMMTHVGTLPETQVDSLY